MPLPYSSKKLEDCHQKLRDAYPAVGELWLARHPDLDRQLDYTYRSPACQLEIWKEGREFKNGLWVVVDPLKVKTHKDGTHEVGVHNVYPAQGLDEYITRDGKIIWPPPDADKSQEAEARRELYRELGRLWVDKGMVAGAVWKYGFKDWPHKQVAYGIV